MGRRKERRRRHGDTFPPDGCVLRQRLRDKLASGEFRAARELARDLVKREPTAEHRRCLVEATLGRAAQLRSAGRLPDAAVLLRSVIDDLGDAPDFAERLAGDLLLAGDWSTADEVSRLIADSAARARLAGVRADAGVLLGEAGLSRLSEDLRSDAATVRGALEAVARGDDTAATAAVGPIPDASPFFEWRLLVEGLVAYHTGEPFVQCWEGLRSDRAPWAIASLYRAAADPVFLASLSPALRAQVEMLNKQLQPEPWLNGLEAVQILVEEGSVDAALQRAADVLRALSPHGSDIRNRLTRVLYWEVARAGAPRQIDRFGRICGPPPDDPLLHRLYALQRETRGDTAGAQEAWAAYAAGLGETNVVQPAEVDLARSLVWLHMGSLAESAGSGSGLPLPVAALLQEDECLFSADHCYEGAVELSPRNLEAHERLLTHLQVAGKQKEVTHAARRLLQSFPEHQLALEILAADALRRGRAEEAVALQRRVAQTRPHDGRVLSTLEAYQLGLARFRAQQGQFDEARAIVMTQLAKGDPCTSRYDLLCRLAAIELRAGDAERGQQLFAEACAAAPGRLAAVLKMLTEAHRLPLGVAYRRTLDREFSDGLRDEPDGPTALEMLSTVSAFERAGITYAGLQTHRQRVFRYLGQARNAPFNRAQLVEICECLIPFPTDKQLGHFATRGQQEHPDDPHFPYFLAMHHLSLGPGKCPFARVSGLLESALTLAQRTPDARNLVGAIEAASSFLEMAMLSHEVEHDLRGLGSGAMRAALADILGLDGHEPTFDVTEFESEVDREIARRKPRKRRTNSRQGHLWDDF